MESIQRQQQANGTRLIMEQEMNGKMQQGFQAPIQQSFNPAKIPKQFLHHNQFQPNHLNSH